MTYELKLEQADVIAVMRALSAQPLGAVLATFKSIEQQVTKQDAAAAVEVKHAD